jgi:predicted membrane protein
MQRLPDLSKAFLLVTALGLVPVALSYGAFPGRSLPWLFGIDASQVNVRHIFRAIMGLYLALVGFWVVGAFRPDVRIPALWSLVLFMWGLGLGRLFSLFLDGWPHPLLVVYLVVEFIVGAAGLYLLRNEARGNV